ncbi:transposase [Alkaliphilus sp. B6464]|nr:transposase [Alkaliphilus sp. B6464]
MLKFTTLILSIGKLVDGIPNTLRTIPGIGPVYAAGLLAEISDINRFEGQASLTKYA